MFFSNIASLTQEVVRRSKNTSEKVSMEERVAILDEYHRRLELSQYSLEASRRILMAGLRGYERIREKAARTGGNINRTRRPMSINFFFKLIFFLNAPLNGQFFLNKTKYFRLRLYDKKS